jgi:hypothetical protein
MDHVNADGDSNARQPTDVNANSDIDPGSNEHPLSVGDADSNSYSHANEHSRADDDPYPNTHGDADTQAYAHQATAHSYPDPGPRAALATRRPRLFMERRDRPRVGACGAVGRG